ncbi:hypothetical protein M427DRAFT_45057 [Gonapodya prolifera JEL478]|uniref:Uncharacterized protein n=1 Tax=Gonapodya prolifera (strain JEL478) TaxID=1344416 RepID=A0A139ACH3_GONPJ|nr:hypothetical protein M427DRAFT_45057 [Gonapodya prolifera JEL478]|eukprot:KXS14448.1 hypothetical protein M427DRAFT_45057 [Gonapodya prolifera JEL478]
MLSRDVIQGADVDWDWVIIMWTSPAVEEQRYLFPVLESTARTPFEGGAVPLDLGLTLCTMSVDCSARIMATPHVLLMGINPPNVAHPGLPSIFLTTTLFNGSKFRGGAGDEAHLRGVPNYSLPALPNVPTFPSSQRLDDFVPMLFSQKKR